MLCSVICWIIDEDLMIVLIAFMNQESILVQRAWRPVHHRYK